MSDDTCLLTKKGSERERARRLAQMSNAPSKTFKLVLRLKPRKPVDEELRAKCSTCRRCPLPKNLYKCLECPNVFFCVFCFEKRRCVGGHSHGHAMAHLHVSNELFGRRVTPADLTFEALKTFYAKETNESIVCDGCEEENFLGLRFKCDICRNYDLCEKCYSEGEETFEHKKNHPMLLASHRSIVQIDPKEIQLGDRLGKGGFGA